MSYNGLNREGVSRAPRPVLYVPKVFEWTLYGRILLGEEFRGMFAVDTVLWEGPGDLPEVPHVKVAWLNVDGNIRDVLSLDKTESWSGGSLMWAPDMLSFEAEVSGGGTLQMPLLYAVFTTGRANRCSDLPGLSVYFKKGFQDVLMRDAARQLASYAFLGTRPDCEDEYDRFVHETWTALSRGFMGDEKAAKRILVDAMVSIPNWVAEEFDWEISASDGGPARLVKFVARDKPEEKNE